MVKRSDKTKVRLIITQAKNLAGGYKGLVKGTFLEAPEVQNLRRLRRENYELIENFFYTANLPLFRIREGNLEYGLGGRQVFDAIAGEDIDAFNKLVFSDKTIYTERGVQPAEQYTLTKLQQKKLEELAADIVWAEVDKLGLERYDNDTSFFPIDTSDISVSKLNDNQKDFAAKAYGSMKTKREPEQMFTDYGETMNMLQQHGVKETKVVLPFWHHIKQYLQEGIVIARVSYLANLEYNYNFDAGGRYHKYGDMSLCGVLNVSLTDAQKISEAYELLTNPAVVPLAADLLTPEAALHVNRVLQLYSNEKKH